MLTQCLTALLAAAVPAHAPTGFTRIKCRAELPDALLAHGDARPAAPTLPPEAQLLLQYLRAAPRGSVAR